MVTPPAKKRSMASTLGIGCLALVGLCIIMTTFMTIFGSLRPKTPAKSALTASTATPFSVAPSSSPISAPGTAAPVAATSTLAPSSSLPPTTIPPTSTPRPIATVPPTVVVAKLGMRVELDGVALTALQVISVKPTDYDKPKAGNVFIAVEVVVENVGMDKLSSNPASFKVRDADGFIYDRAYISADPALKMIDLARGDKARGLVPFEVGEKARGFSLLWNYNYAKLPLRIDL